jgi:ribosomal protein S18 acetylase RimI-like enzyme
VGFVSVKTHTDFAAEVYVMGVKRSWHRRGIGRALIEAVVALAISQGVRFLTVKTLSPSNDDPNYARTRLFYEAVGFLPIEEFPMLCRTGRNAGGGMPYCCRRCWKRLGWNSLWPDQLRRGASANART